MFLVLQSAGDYFFKPFLENFGHCLFIIWRLFFIVLLIRIVTQFVDCNPACRSYKLLQEGRFTSCGLWAKINRKLPFSGPLIVATSSPRLPGQGAHWPIYADSHPCCGYSADWNDHSAFQWSQLGTVMFAKTLPCHVSSKLYPSLLVLFKLPVALYLLCTHSQKDLKHSDLDMALLYCGFGQVMTMIKLLTFPSVLLLQSTSIYLLLLKLLLSENTNWPIKLAGGKHFGKQGHWTNVKVAPWTSLLAGLEFPCVGPTSFSTLASTDVPILDICQEWEVRNAKTRRPGWTICQGFIQGTSWKEINWEFGLSISSWKRALSFPSQWRWEYLNSGVRIRDYSLMCQPPVSKITAFLSCKSPYWSSSPDPSL